MLRAESPARLAAAIAGRIDHRRPEPLVVAGASAEWEEAAGRADELAELLAALPVATVAVAAGGVSESARGLVEAFDLLAEEPLDAAPWAGAFERAPQAASVLAVLVRVGGGSLLAESLAYSALQAGAEHAAWLASSPPRRPPEPGRRVRVDERPGHVEVRLVRPRRHNAFDARMREELCDALDALAARPAEPIVLRGEGPSFCSGGDLGEFGTLADPVSAHYVRTGRSAAARLQRLGARTVAVMHGHCIGAGVELAAFCRRVIASEDAVLRLPETGFGLLPGSGGTVSIPRRIGHRAFLELALSGSEVDAATALEMGLVDEVAPSAGLDARVEAAIAAVAA